MKIKHFIILFLLVPVFNLYSFTYQTNYLKISDEIIKNPCAGLCFMPDLEPASKYPDWLYEVCSIAYFRLDWADVIDKNGNYIFEKLDKEIFSTYRKKGLHLAFRIMASNPHSSKKNVMPFGKLKYKFPTVKHISVYGKEQNDPLFWHPNYLAEHGKMMEAFGEYALEHPDIDYVDLGGMGDWGEMHLSRWTKQELIEWNFTYKKYLQSVLALLEQMERCFPNTIKAFCCAPIGLEGLPDVFAQIMDWSVRCNWWIRSDGFSIDGPPYYVKHYTEKHWQKVGFIFEPAGGINHDYFGGPYSVQDYFTSLIYNKASIANLMGMWDLNKLTDADIKIVYNATKKIGYRFAVTRVIMPDSFKRNPDNPMKIPIKIIIQQQGSAPYYGTAMLEISLFQNKTKVAGQSYMPGIPLSQITPAEEQEYTIMVDIPKNVKPGETDLKLAIEDLKYGNLKIANYPSDKKNRITLGSINIQKGNNLSYIKFNTDDIFRVLRAQPEVKIAKDKNIWKLMGRARAGWNYAYTSAFRIKPKSLYRTTVKMKAWKSDVKTSRLFFKFGINNSDHQWIRNINTEQYDFTKEGTIQEFSTVFQQNTDDELWYYLAIEKGNTEPATIKAEILSWTVEEIPLP